MFDDGSITGVQLTKKNLINIGIAVVGTLAFMFFPGIDPFLGKVLGLLFMFIWTMATRCLPSIVCTMLLGVLAILLDCVKAGAFLTAFGSSPFIMVMSLLFLSEGAKNTNFSARLSYLMIYKLGTSPSRLVLAFFISTYILSMFIADIPATLLIMAVAVGVMEECGEKKGGRLGKALSLTASWASITGGAALISGSGMNVTGITMLENVTEGALTITYGQWAMVAIPFTALMIIPAWLILVKCFKLKDYKVNEISKESVKKKLDDLGPLTSAEKRFLLIVGITVLLFATSGQTKLALPLISMIGMLLSICPGIGTVDYKKSARTIPWDTLILIGVTVAFSGAITACGLGDLIVNSVLGWTAGQPIWLITAFVALLGLLLHLPFAGNPNGVIAVYVAAIIPLATSVLNVHPGLLLMPAMLTGTTSFVQPIGTSYFLVSGFGYQDFKDSFIPSLLLAIPWVILLTICCVCVIPFFGW